ncbi:MAG: branched-chain amino acid ABC transporter permease [Verrucomicrobia bacterium]|nr:branched-chain amino acid ABC transporter permease [Verrucomicrobiota bacterium]
MRKESSSLVAGFVVALAALTLPGWLGAYYVQLATRSLIIGMVTMSFVLLAGYSGMVSLAQMSFFAMAGYVIGVGVKTHQLPFVIAIPLAIFGATLLSALFATVAIRAQGNYFLMMTLALAQLFEGVAMQWVSVTNGYNGIAGVPRPVLFGLWSLQDSAPLYYASLGCTAGCFALLRHLLGSPLGLCLRGVRENPRRLSALGFNVQMYRFIAIVVSGAVAGVAGVLGVFQSGVIAPHTANLQNAVMVVMAALVGGVSRLEGAILGSFVTVFLVAVTSSLTPRYWMIVGAIFTAVVIFLPNGLLGKRLRRKRGDERLPWIVRRAPMD